MDKRKQISIIIEKMFSKNQCAKKFTDLNLLLEYQLSKEVENYLKKEKDIDKRMILINEILEGYNNIFNIELFSNERLKNKIFYPDNVYKQRLATPIYLKYFFHILLKNISKKEFLKCIKTKRKNYFLDLFYFISEDNSYEKIIYKDNKIKYVFNKMNYSKKEVIDFIDKKLENHSFFYTDKKAFLKACSCVLKNDNLFKDEGVVELIGKRKRMTNILKRIDQVVSKYIDIKRVENLYYSNYENDNIGIDPFDILIKVKESRIDNLFDLMNLKRNNPNLFKENGVLIDKDLFVLSCIN
jgi:transposase-like protein